MAQKHSFSKDIPGVWRLFGEIELPVGAAINDHISTWLVETLRPLDLNDHFINKVLASAELASVYDSLSAIEAGYGQIHIQTFIPEDSQSNGHSWGFFRVERKGDPKSAEPKHYHTIAFYLYREGM
jgi:hypothetical protein